MLGLDQTRWLLHPLKCFVVDPRLVCCCSSPLRTLKPLVPLPKSRTVVATITEAETFRSTGAFQQLINFSQAHLLRKKRSLHLEIFLFFLNQTHSLSKNAGDADRKDTKNIGKIPKCRQWPILVVCWRSTSQCLRTLLEYIQKK